VGIGVSDNELYYSILF